MRLVLVAGLAALALVLAACGEEADEGAGTGETIEIVETDFALDPADVTVDGPGTYTFRAVNEGETTHALEIEGQGIEEETEEFGPDESAELTVELTEPGEYEMYCPVGNHREMGMVGTVTVGGGGGGTGGTGTNGDTTTDGTTTDEETTTDDDDSGYGSG
jgi:plastocyanin